MKDGTPRLSSGYLAALPLFLAYEIGMLAVEGRAERAPAERVVGRLLFLFREHLQWARVALLLALAGLAFAHLRRTAQDERGPWRAAAALVGLGVLAGILLGPALVALHSWLDAGPLVAAPEPARDLGACLRLVGAAPWEELLFRVGLYGGVFLFVRRASVSFGLDARLANPLAELVALLASALSFAAFHLEFAQRLVGSSGEAFHHGLFLWRVSAGILLGALFRWRGFGVAAWAHAMFNLGIALGIRA